MQMRASEIEFRFRFPIIAAIVLLGFWAPWISEADLASRISLLDWLALEASRTGLLRFAYAIPAMIVLAGLVGLIGAVLRVWGTAYLGYLTVHNPQMLAGTVMADGPYRYMRNPLYVGSLFTMAATAFVMPPSGALVAAVLLPVFYLRLALGEEAFLSVTLGQPYRDYLAAVPRFLPRLRSSLPPAGNKPHWLTAIFTEIYPIGVFVTLGALAWRYDHELMLDGILWSFVGSLVARGLMKAAIPTLACVAFVAVAVGWFHMSWLRAGLIGIGAWLILRAMFENSAKAKAPESA
jgi:protein-S-isoprenylcysteine O-methyltransferase Ste14